MGRFCFRTRPLKTEGLVPEIEQDYVLEPDPFPAAVSRVEIRLEVCQHNDMGYYMYIGLICN